MGDCFFITGDHHVSVLSVSIIRYASSFTDRCRTTRDRSLPAQVDRWGLNHAPERSGHQDLWIFLGGHKHMTFVRGYIHSKSDILQSKHHVFTILFPLSKPDVFSSITTALTSNNARSGSKAFKELIAGASPFLSSSLLSSCLKYRIITLLQLFSSHPALLQFKNVSFKVDVHTAKPSVSGEPAVFYRQ